MIHSHIDLIFPPRIIPLLSTERGEPWQNLVATVGKNPPGSLEQVAFILMMARLSACSTCNSDSFRATQGCSVCACQVLRRFHGSDEELIALYAETRVEVSHFLNKNEHSTVPQNGMERLIGKHVPENIP